MRDLSTETTGMSVINLMKAVVIRSGNRSDEGGGRLSRRRGYADRRPEGINDVESEHGRSEEMVENHRRDLEVGSEVAMMIGGGCWWQIGVVGEWLSPEGIVNSGGGYDSHQTGG
ncbi:hypothetical protein L2E82_23045 [Cichorium intybus]|uniref:Uncharacterized protein n=1 Tax=Cichorium intybus TaxID=13427 RepID=A0ACB9DZM8_CICIN|nr:hypothetical protein L2E82_23045 [Cichorium intybus]